MPFVSVTGRRQERGGARPPAASRALEKLDEQLRPALKRLGLLTRDARQKERKNYGQRRRPRPVSVLEADRASEISSASPPLAFGSLRAELHWSAGRFGRPLRGCRATLVRQPR